MRKGAGRIVSALFALLAAAVILTLGVTAPITLFGNAVDGFREGGPVAVYLFIGIGAFVMSVVLVILLNRIRRALVAPIDAASGPSPAAGARQTRTFKVVPPPGLFDRAVSMTLVVLCVVLCVTGFGQYSTLDFEETYIGFSRFHSILGLLTLPVLMAFLFRQARRRFSLKIVLLLTLYPLMYVLVMMSPGPLLATYVAFNLGLFPLGIFLLARAETPRDRQPLLVAAAIALFGLVLVCMTGFVPMIDPLSLRFSMRQRIFHSVLAPLAVLLPAAWYLISRKAPGGAGTSRRILLVCGLVAVAGLVLGGSLHGFKELRLERAREGNFYRSPSLAKETGVEFRTIPPEVLADDGFCRDCHKIPFRQWSRSVHANAARTVTFQGVVKSLIDQRGPDVALDCAACHDPEVALANRPELLVDPEHVARSQGVGCRTCHYMSVAGDKNALYGLQVPRSDLFQGTAEARKDRILYAVQEHVGDVTKPASVSGRTCFPCHSLRSIRNGHEFIPIDSVTSFIGSSFNSDMPCHRCHMPRIEKDDHSYSWMDHSFFGIQQELSGVIIPDGLDADRRIGLETFRRDNGKWLAGELPVLNGFEAFMDETFKAYRFTKYFYRYLGIAESIRVASAGNHFDLSVKSSLWKEAALDLVLVSRSLHVGHDFPSSLFANIVDIWFELVLTDAAGTEVFRSGFNREDPAHRLGRIEVDANRREIAPQDSFSYTDIVNWKFIEPDKDYEDAYTIPVPPSARFPLSARYSLKYLRYNKDFTRSIPGLGTSRSFPIRTLCEQTFVIDGP